MPYEDHGDIRHITMKDLKAAAEAASISVQEVVENLEQAVGEAETEPASTPES